MVIYLFFFLLFRTGEAVTLLSLLQGSAQLLTDVLTTFESSTPATAEQRLTEVVYALSDVGVHVLSPLQAKEILKQRIYTTL